MGRPTDYCEDLVTAICKRISAGDSLRTICEEEDFPARSTVFYWLSKYDEFSDQYARACRDRTNFHADEILEIADDGSNDWMERTNSEGECIGWSVNGEAVQRSKLRIESRKWLMEKLEPKKYGNKLELAGPDGSSIQPVINVTVGTDKPESS